MSVGVKKSGINFTEGPLLKKFILFNIVLFIISCIGLYAYAYFSPKLDIKNANQFYIYDDKENISANVDRRRAGAQRR